MAMRFLDEVPAKELEGKRVLVRAGLDLSLNSKGEVSDMFRVRKACPTIEYLQKAGARVVILSHIGRDTSATNAPVARALSRFLKVSYVPDLFGHIASSALMAMCPGDVVLLENVRQFYDLEKANDEAFAKRLSTLGEMYVNDAFSNSHRAHASMVRLPALMESFAGMVVREEVAHLSQALCPPHPAFAIIGGAKFETKDPVVRLFLEKYDGVSVVGAIANDILKSRGFPVGRSKISEHAPEKEVAEHAHLVAPVDVVAQRSDGHAFAKKPDAVGPDDKIVDIGPDTVAALAPHIARAKFIIWNGPTGLYEEGFVSWTHALAELVAKRVAEGANAVIGGGDTIAAIQESGFDLNSLGFLSTGGGAMLEFLLKGTLPALEALGYEGPQVCRQ